MGEPEFRLGLALGGGGAAALSYIGVLEEFSQAGIHFDRVAGTSCGAIVGAAYAAGRLGEFREVMTSITRGRMFTMFDPTWGTGGFLGGRRAMAWIEPAIGGEIENLPVRFAAIATDLDSGEEVVMESGPVIDAVRASIAIPGVFGPVAMNGRILVDGGLVNPIPVSVARGMDADFVVAVSVLRLSGVIEGIARSVMLDPREIGPSGGIDDADAASAEPAIGVADRISVLDVLAKGSAVVQSHIAASRLRDSPPDAFLAPRSEHIGLFEVMRCAEAVECGREAARRALPGLLACIENAHRQRGNPIRRLMNTALARRRAI